MNYARDIELELKVAPASKTPSLVAHTSKCGHALSHILDFQVNQNFKLVT